MKKCILRLTVLVLLWTVFLWAFIGVVRTETQTFPSGQLNIDWKFFIKHNPSFRLKFENPIPYYWQDRSFGLLEDLSKKVEFIDFCSIRFGVTDTVRCYELLSRKR